MGKFWKNLLLLGAGCLTASWFSACDPALTTTKPQQTLRDTPVALKSTLNEEVIRIPMTVANQGIFLEGTLYRPAGPGPFPLLVLSHGTPEDQAQRRVRERFAAQSSFFTNLGFVVVIPMRRGYGRSEGSFAEVEGQCEQAHYDEAGQESARDLLATVRHLQAQPYVNPRQVVLAGGSTGGFASLALASRGFPGLLGVISFAGGRGVRAGRVCSPPALIAALAGFGRTARVPTLWIYAKNDTYFQPPLVRQMYQAFTGAGGKATLVMLPPFGEDGHFLFPDARGLPLWAPLVQSFLDGLGISRPHQAPVIALGIAGRR